MDAKNLVENKICNMDCFNCPFEDCVNDEITKETATEQDFFDDRVVFDNKTKKQQISYLFNHSESGPMSQKKYRQSEKGKNAIKRYNSSDKAKETRKRYRSSERAKELNRIWQREYRLRKKQATAN